MQKIETYSVLQMAGGKNKKLKSQIWLRNNEHHVSGVLYFYKNGADTPAKDKKVGSLIYGYCQPEQYSEILDLLRNEGPVYLWYIESRNLAYISTSEEPVAEGELDHN